MSRPWTPIDFGHDLSAGFQFQSQVPFVLCDLCDKVAEPMGPWMHTPLAVSKQSAGMKHLQEHVILYVAEKTICTRMNEMPRKFLQN